MMIKRTQFTIKLVYGSTGYNQEIGAGMDTGSKTTILERTVRSEAINGQVSELIS